MISLQREWMRPSTILFATECPANEKNFTFALSQANESGANLVLLHVTDGRTEPLIHHANARGGDRTAAHSAKLCFEPFAQRARNLGIHCRVIIRRGVAAEEILNLLREQKIDRVVIGAHTSGPVGKPLVGSVAETLLRRADVPVSYVGPFLVEGTFRNIVSRVILCSVSAHRSSQMVARFAAELAAWHRALLILLHVIPPQDAKELLLGRTISQMEQELLAMIPINLRARVNAKAMVTLGDPTEELLYQGRAIEANLIVMGAHDATHFAAVSNASIIYKVLAYARCPVLTLSPVLLADYGPASETLSSADVNYMAGVF